MPALFANSARLRPLADLLWRSVSVGLALWICLGQRLAADPEAADPEAVFAAFVYNFCLFTQWSDLGLDTAREHPLVIVSMGKPLPALAPLIGRTVRKHPIRVVFLPADGQLPEDCHVLICNELAPGRRDALLALAAKRPILTIANQPGFCQAGGILEFFVAAERMRFRVNQDQMKRAGLRIHSRLLQLAESLSSREGRD